MSRAGRSRGQVEDDDGGDAELEAELLALVGGPAPAPAPGPRGKAPLPMEAIEKMAALCMKDEEEEEEEELDDEDDLMAELREVLAGGEGDEDVPAPPAEVPEAHPDPGGLESALAERAAMYRTALGNARTAGDGARARRYERGLRTLESMLASVKKGKKIDEEEIPPPVPLGQGAGSPPPAPAAPAPSGSPAPPPPPPSAGEDSGRFPLSGAAPPPPPPPPGSERAEALLRGRQREYKTAALRAKQRGDLAAAARCYRLAKSFDSLLEAAAKGEPVELSSVPPPPDPEPPEPPCPDRPQPAAAPPAPDAKPPAPVAEPPPAPRDALEALQQRMERYKMAAAQAKSNGDERKARMHERIVKQYQDAIRAHKAGKPVDFSELPVPPGFQPVQGAETPSGAQSVAAVLEAAAKLAGEELRAEEDAAEDAAAEEEKPAAPTRPAAAAAQPKPPPRAAAAPKNAAKARQQLAFLEGRRQQLTRAALRAKRDNDVEGAKLLLRRAKGLAPMIEAARGGLPVDIAKVPEAPVHAEDFVLVPRRGVRVPPEAAARYLELVRLLRQQHEMCVSYSRQFAHLGNIAEITRFEKMAEDCKQNMEILRQAHARGAAPPKHRYEQRTFSVVKNFPELNGSDMVLSIVKGINLPAPPGVAPNDLDAFVRFEFPFPNAEEAQKDKTAVVKNTDSPEFGEQFKLQVNRAHRGLRRVLHSKGVRFEVVHKGGLFKPDRVLGTAQLKLEALETACEVREILELLDGRRPTGGRLEVVVRIREPLSCQQLELRTERWLVLVPSAAPPASAAATSAPEQKTPKGPDPPVQPPAPLQVAVPSARPAAPPRDANHRAVPALPSLNLLAFDREKLERKMLAFAQAQRPVPPELREQHQELSRRAQCLRSRLQQGGAPFRKEYLAQLERYLQLYTEAARRLGTEGNRDAAKEALYKRNLVESELQKLRR